MATITKKQQELIGQTFRLLDWNTKRQQGFCKYVCGQPWPQTTEDASKVYEGLEAMILRLVKPHSASVFALIQLLYRERGEMTEWERVTFLPDVKRRADAGQKLTPAMIHKVREIAHKYGAECGFPSLKTLAEAQYGKERNTTE